MNTILNEQILRIKQVMGICETKEEDKKIIDDWFEYVKNTSHEDAVNQLNNGGKYLELRQESIDAGERIFVYEKIEEAKSIDELINLFRRDFKFIDYVRKHFWGTGNQRYLEMKQALCLLNGGSENQCYDLDLSSDILLYDKPINVCVFLHHPHHLFLIVLTIYPYGNFFLHHEIFVIYSAAWPDWYNPYNYPQIQTFSWLL
jgi:hypothetical protein